MTEPLQVGQFAIVDHEPVDRGPNAGVFHGRGPADDRAELYILAEGTTPAGEAFAGHVVSAIGQAFNGLDMSLTGSLRRLFSEAERNLRDWNRKSIAQHRVSIGLTCFARRSGQAVIAQSGPSVAFHLSGGEVRAYYADEEHGMPIGMAAPVDPQLTRIDFLAGDRLLLISTTALREIDDEIIGGILSLPPQQVLQDLYQRLSHVRHLTAVLVLHGAEQPAAAAAQAEDEPYVIDATAAVTRAEAAEHDPDDNSHQASLFIDDANESVVTRARRQMQDVTIRNLETFVPALTAEIPKPLRKAAGDQTLQRMAEERFARAARARAAENSLMAGPAPARPNWRGGASVAEGGSEGARRGTVRRDSFSRGLVREEIPRRPVPTFGRAPLVDEMAEGLRASASVATVASPLADTIATDNHASISTGGSLVRVRNDMGGRWRGGNTLSGRATTSGQLPPTWLVIVIGLGLLLALVGVLTVPRILSEQSGDRYAKLVDGAEQRIALANAQADASQRRVSLTEAKSMLLEAKEADPDGPQAQQLLTDVSASLTAMDAIVKPASVEPIANLAEFGERPVVASRLVVGDDAGYLLDSTSNQVIAVTLATGERKVVFSENKDNQHGRPVGLAYLDSADGGAAVLIIDAAKNLFSYNASTSLRQIPFAPPSNLNVTDIATDGRDLFVLDASASAVYRFAQGEGGFALAPTRVLETPDLAAARRLMVDSGARGTTMEIITSDANGTVRRFGGQLALVLAGSGIDKKLTAAEPVQRLGAGELAALDGANDRIVVLRSDGTFERQYRHDDFKGISAFAIRNGAGYVFSGGVLRKVTW